MGIELMTSSLPRMRSTPELHRHSFERGRRIELPFPAWKAGIIAVIRTPLVGSCSASARLWARMDSNHRRRTPADLQSAPIDRSGTCPDLCLDSSRHRWEPIGGFEPSTPRLQITCSGQLSYIGMYVKPLLRKGTAKIDIICKSANNLSKIFPLLPHRVRNTFSGPIAWRAARTRRECRIPSPAHRERAPRGIRSQLRRGPP